ncbi:hypothetical protein V9L05_13550 [Bernardetia sp. Wsw4-3y2]|uniref:hypothetical protein n=1 Tax=Bernardetia sp. Wsw4-3y2 TaxID=3127471 RepID=UPI0030D2CF79
MNINNNINTNTGNSSLRPVFPSVKRPVVEQPLAQTIHKNFIDTPTHFETDYISMKWIPEKRRIDVIWKQFVSEEKVREVLLKEVAMIRHTKVKCLFLDAQKFKGTNPNIPRWANEVWSQMVHDAGLKHFATVVSDKDIFAVFSLKYGMGEKLTSLVNCAVFKTVEEGEVWLRQYTHPESPVYSDDELEEIMEEYENPTATTNFETILKEEEEKKYNQEDSVELSMNPMHEVQKEETVKEGEDILGEIAEKKLEKFDLKNEIVSEKEELKDNFEDIEELDEVEDENRLSQIQVFSNFEDLENHIQTIEAKYKINEEKADTSENEI